MNGKKILVVITLLAILGYGWVVSIKSISRVDEINEQNRLTELADSYYSKGLYIRAIPEYKNALKINTVNNPEIESRLLNTYYRYEDMEEYTRLVEKRHEKGTAKEEEYIESAKYLIEKFRYSSGMELLKKGLDALHSEKIRRFYEDNRYAYNMRTTGFKEALSVSTAKHIPVSDGNKWYYADDYGEVTKGYDQVTTFNGKGYAIISIDGRYYTINSSGDRYGVDETGVKKVLGLSGSRVIAEYDGKVRYFDYDFKPIGGDNFIFDGITVESEAKIAVKSKDKWKLIESGGKDITDYIIDDVAVNSLGCAYFGNIAMLKYGNEWFMCDNTGNKLSEVGYSGAKAPEDMEGPIAVCNAEKKWGFVDRSGKQIIDFKYDDAYSFSNGLAAVKDGDYWKYISVYDRAEIEGGYEMAHPFHNGFTTVKLPEGIAFLRLDYYEGMKEESTGFF